MRSDTKKRGAKAPPPTSNPRSARTRADRNTKTRRVYRIAMLMAAGEWERGTTAAELAEEWELSEVSVRDMSAEASRLLELTTEDRQALVNLVRVRLRQIGEADGNDRVQALRTILEHMGELWQRQKHEVHVHRDPLEEWTDEEMREYLNSGRTPERLRERGNGDPSRA